MGRKSACPCTQCATLAVPRMVSNETRRLHKKQHGIERVDCKIDDDALAEEPAVPVVANQVDVPVSEELQSIFVNEEAFARDVVLLVVNSGLP